MFRLFILLFLSTYLTYSQCPSGNIQFSTQQEIDDFPINYPNCNIISGNLNISGDDIFNLNGLSQLTEITGYFSISDTSITDFNSLTNLTRIGGNLSISINTENNAIYDLFNALEIINGSLIISTQNIVNNVHDIQITGLNTLVSLGGDIKFTCQTRDVEIGICPILENIPGEIRIEGSLTYFVITGFNNLASCGSLYLTSLDLSNINVSGNFNSLKSINGNARLAKGLFDLEFNALEKIDGNFLFPFSRSNQTYPLLEHISGTIATSGDLQFHGSSFVSITAPNLTHLGGVSVGLRGYINLIMDTLQEINDNVTVHEGNASLSMESLNRMTGDFRIEYEFESPKSPFINFSDVVDIYGDITLKKTSYTTLQHFTGFNYSSANFVEITNNADLSICNQPSLCFYLNSGATNNNITNNASGCGSVVAILYNCGLANSINGKALYNFNNNDCSGTEYPTINATVTSSNGINDYVSYTNQNGEFNIYTNEDGAFTTEALINNTNYDISPTSHSTSFSGFGNLDTVNFCATPNTVVNDVEVYIIPTSVLRPGVPSSYKVFLINNGTTVQNGSVSLNFDETKIWFNNSSITPDSQTSSSILWNYFDLYPYQIQEIDITFDVDIPPVVNDGDVLSFEASVTPITNDSNPQNNLFTLNNTVVNSYDPNDKTVLEGEHLLIDNTDEYLHFLIRFQNLGSAPAIDIRITDILHSFLDWNSFKPIGASHLYTTNIVNGRFVEFNFENINLPDSASNEEDSHGFVFFKIKPKNNLELGDIIKNNAAIFFDYNPPVITNTTNTRIVTDTDLDGIYDYLDNCPIVPNPDQLDTDGNGLGDACDGDYDGDGIPDATDNCPLFSNANQADSDNDGIGDVCDDNDNDGIININDNCPATPNPDQLDTDGDGQGDVCDDDDDDDGILDIVDNCPLTHNVDQTDTDNDGIGDLCDDSDNDNTLDINDNCPLVSNPDQLDTDGDGQGNACDDDDDDDDGILDLDDDCPLYPGVISNNGCPFDLPVDNFTIETLSETCPNENNARIRIHATANYNYEATLTSNGNTVSIPNNTFNDSLFIDNLASGFYQLCITIASENYEQCFSLELTQSHDLTGDSNTTENNLYNLSLSGATTYIIVFNNQEFILNAPNETSPVLFSQPLTQLVNTVKVTTNKVCQGKYEETITISNDELFSVYPNPFNNSIFISSISKNASGELNIYDISGKLIFRKDVIFPLNNLELNLSKFNSGIYLLELITKQEVYRKKLIKN